MAALTYTQRDSADGLEQGIAKILRTQTGGISEGSERGITRITRTYSHPGAEGSDRLIRPPDATSVLRDVAEGSDRVMAKLIKIYFHPGAEGSDSGYNATAFPLLYDIADGSDRVTNVLRGPPQKYETRRDTAEGSDRVTSATRSTAQSAVRRDDADASDRFVVKFARVYLIQDAADGFEQVSSDVTDMTVPYRDVVHRDAADGFDRITITLINPAGLSVWDGVDEHRAQVVTVWTGSAELPVVSVEVT